MNLDDYYSNDPELQEFHKRVVPLALTTHKLAVVIAAVQFMIHYGNPYGIHEVNAIELEAELHGLLHAESEAFEREKGES